MTDILKKYLPTPLKNILRPLYFLGRHCFYELDFRVKYGFPPPPAGTDLVGYEQIIEFIETHRIYQLDGDLLEVGTFVGGGAYKLSMYIARKAPNKKLYVVDIFDPSFDVTENTRGIKMYELYSGLLKGYSQWEVFRQVTRFCANIVVIRGDSKEITLPVEKLCFAFIDGNHSPTYVKNDFYLAWERLVPGGTVGFDDYGYDLPQVTSTIDDLIEQHKEEISRVERIGTKLIFIQKRRYV